MKCRDARELLNSYFDNGLEPSNDKVLMEHIKNCPECSKELLFLMEYKKTLKGIKPVRAPQNFMAELRFKLEKEEAGGLKRTLDSALETLRNFTFPREAAGVIAVAVLIFFLYSPMFRGVKEMKTYREDQPVVTEPPELIVEEKKAKPLSAEKKDDNEMRSIPSVKKSVEFGTSKKRAIEEAVKEDLAMDSISGSSGASGENSLDDNDEAAASGIEEPKEDRVEKAESEKRLRMKSTTRRRSESSLDPLSDITEMKDFSSPGNIIKEYSTEILDSREEENYTIFIIKIEEEKLDVLIERLKERYVIDSSAKVKSGTTLTVKLVLTEKTD